MTLTARPCHPDHRSYRLGDADLTVAVDAGTRQLLVYEEEGRGGVGSVGIDVAMLAERTSTATAVEVRYDLQDCYIDICAPEVLYLFTDNFDYQHLRRDFVRGLLSDEIYANKIHVYELSNEYAARVHNLRSYDAVSRDVVNRWTFPIVPDTNLVLPESTYRYARQNVYKEEGVMLARSAQIGEGTVLGSGTSVGEHTRITQSVLGRGCVIGSSVSISGCYLLSNVVIEDGAKLSNSIVCDGAVVQSNAVIESGSIISYKVVIGPGFRVPAYSRISLQPQPEAADNPSDDEREYAAAGGIYGSDEEEDDDDDDDDQSDSFSHHVSGPTTIDYDESEVGQGGSGILWASARDVAAGVGGGGEDEERRMGMGPPTVPPGADSTAESEEELAANSATADTSGVAEERGDAPVDEEQASDEDEDDDAQFAREVQETFKRGVAEGLQQDNVVLEINALKMAYNRTFADCAGSLFTAILHLALDPPNPTLKQLLQRTQTAISKWSALLRRFLKTEDDQVEVLLAFEEYCAEEEASSGPGQGFTTLFAKVLQILYDEDVLLEDAIMLWANEKKFADEADRRFLKQCGQFLQWLQEAESEEDEEKEEEDGDIDEGEEKAEKSQSSSKQQDETPAKDDAQAS
eukprot:jgi/Chlat1/1734/Chrsp13S02153